MDGEETSSSSHVPPREDKVGLEEAAEEMERAVPITACPARRAAREREVPMPEEAPVIRKVCFWEAVVGAAMLWVLERRG